MPLPENRCTLLSVVCHAPPTYALLRGVKLPKSVALFWAVPVTKSSLRGMDPELTTELKSEEAVTDERAGEFSLRRQKTRRTADGAGRAAFD